MTTINKIKRFFARSTRFGLMAAAGLMAGGASAAGFDGLTLVTNAWFAADFTAQTAGTVITQGSTTGISSGTGSWTAVPTTGTAKIAADAGGEATLLSINVDIDELLTFSPAPFSITSGYETVAVDIKTDPVYELPTLDNSVQGAFLIYMDGEENLSLQGYTANDWTNLVGVAADGLTNVWMTVYTDYATVSNVRYVRYSVKPTSGALTILEDSVGTTWFPSAASTKTALESVSFTGTGNIRTFSGKELQEAVASYNGVNYGTVAAAIAAAEEGGTVTLVKGATETALSITKDITLDLAEKTTSIPYISIAEGKTLTLKRANKSNQIGYFTGGGNLVVSGNNTFRWDSMSGTSTLASITQESSSGGISISGHGTINVSGDVSVAATLTFTPSSAEPAYISDGFTIKLTANAVSAGTLNGAATIETEEGTTVGAGTFYGPISGGVAASGNFTSQGVGLDGTIAVANGKTFTIGNRLASMTNKRFHLDATDSSTYTLEEETANLTQIKGGDNTYSLESGSTAAVLNSGDENHFDGQPYFQFEGSKYARGNKVSAKSYIAVTHPDSLGGYLARYSDQDRLGTDSNVWFARCYGNNRDSYLTQNGTTDRTATAGADTIISLSTRITSSDNREDHLGTLYVGAIAEFVGFNSAISVEDRMACEMYLMDKWNFAAAANFKPFASTAAVEVGTGATLDLGGYTQTVASFTGGGTVQNGTLLTADNVYTNTGALYMPVVADAKVVIGEGATALTLVGDDASTMTIEFSDEFIALNGSITITATGLTESNFENAPSDIFRYGLTDNGDGTWTLGPATTFTAATYIWSPVGNSTDWTDLANWKVGEQSVAVLPQNVDTVVFPELEDEDAFNTIVLTADKTVRTVTVNGKTRISGAGIICYGIPVVVGESYTSYNVEASGSGTLYLGAGGAIKTQQSKVSQTLTISIASIVIEGTSENHSYIAAHRGGTSSGSAPSIIMTSVVSGSGYVELGGWRASFDLDASKWAGFTGSAIVFDDGIPRNSTKFTNNGTNGGNPWDLSQSRWSGRNTGNFTPSGSTYRFGELAGSPLWSAAASYNSATLYIGCLNTDFTLGGQYNPGSSKKGNFIHKEGSGTMTFNGSGVEGWFFDAGTVELTNNTGVAAANYTFNGGALTLGDEFTVDISDMIKNSTAAIKIDTGIDRTWATALAASNVGGLSKSGAGTLTLSEAPAYTGFEISVEAGKVVVPNTATNTKPAKGTKRTVVGDTLEYTKGPDIENGSTTNVEDIADQNEANAVAATYNVTLTDAQIAQGLETSYYKVVATQVGETTTYAMSVVLDEEEVGVDLGEDDEGVDAPVTFTGDKPTFYLKNSVKKGLCYGIAKVSNPSSSDGTVVAEQQATADSQAISLTPTLNFSSGNVIYYKLSVSDTAQINTP